jgi:hypothetical protein
VAARAELTADRGAAAEARAFFRSRAFYDAEGVTHTLRIEAPAWAAAVPVLVREVPGSELVDAVSPYGYPGGEVAGGQAPRPAEVDWTATGLVSIFGRERLGAPPWLASGRERSTVLLHDPHRPRRLRSRLAEQIRANERSGWSVETLRGPATGEDERAAFARAYEQTMHRAGAAERYFFSASYFRTVLGFGDSWLFLARSPGRSVAAGAIAALSDGLLHYFLGGTIDEHLADSPFKNVVEAMVGLAEELDVPLNLGGGMKPGDGLEAFKRGFANRELPFRTHEVVCDPAEYGRLGTSSPEVDFFPRYRAA